MDKSKFKKDMAFGKVIAGKRPRVVGNPVEESEGIVNASEVRQVPDWVEQKFNNPEFNPIGDGMCFYYSMIGAMNLMQYPNRPADALQLKRQILDWASEHRSMYRGFFDNDTENFDSWHANKSKSSGIGSWADERILFGFTQIYKNITVHSFIRDHGRVEYLGIYNENQPFQVYLGNKGNLHFVILLAEPTKINPSTLQGNGLSLSSSPIRLKLSEKQQEKLDKCKSNECIYDTVLTAKQKQAYPRPKNTKEWETFGTMLSSTLKKKQFTSDDTISTGDRLNYTFKKQKYYDNLQHNKLLGIQDSLPPNPTNLEKADAFDAEIVVRAVILYMMNHNLKDFDQAFQTMEKKASQFHDPPGPDDFDKVNELESPNKPIVSSSSVTHKTKKNHKPVFEFPEPEDLSKKSYVKLPEFPEAPKPRAMTMKEVVNQRRLAEEEKEQREKQREEEEIQRRNEAYRMQEDIPEIEPRPPTPENKSKKKMHKWVRDDKQVQYVDVPQKERKAPAQLQIKKVSEGSGKGIVTQKLRQTKNKNWIYRAHTGDIPKAAMALNYSKSTISQKVRKELALHLPPTVRNSKTQGIKKEAMKGPERPKQIPTEMKFKLIAPKQKSNMKDIITKTKQK